MPAVPDSNSAIRLVIFQGSSSIGASSIISPIPTGSGNIIEYDTFLNTEISPTAGNIYGIVFITSGSTSFQLTENGSVFNYTHGSTKLLQTGTFY